MPQTVNPPVVSTKYLCSEQLPATLDWGTLVKGLELALSLASKVMIVQSITGIADGNFQRVWLSFYSVNDAVCTHGVLDHSQMEGHSLRVSFTNEQDFNAARQHIS